mgnify:CR=1 FL=1
MVTVWTNGCFDVLHRGHVELLKYCRKVGHFVIVGLDSDDKVSKDKGPDRPFNCLEDRIAMLESIKFVDMVEVFSSKEELEDKIKYHSPDFLIVGSDWRGKDVVGEKYAKKVLFFERIGNYSTTKILNSKK